MVGEPSLEGLNMLPVGKNQIPNDQSKGRVVVLATMEVVMEQGVTATNHSNSQETVREEPINQVRGMVGMVGMATIVVQARHSLFVGVVVGEVVGRYEVEEGKNQVVVGG